MSLKENVDYIKQEISSEEKFFESFFKIEKIYKKYKLLIIAIVVLILGYFIGNNIVTYVKEQNANAANKAYNTLINNPTDKNAIKILEEKNKTLLEIAMYKNSSDKTLKNNVIFLDKIAQFNLAIKNNDIKSLNKLILDNDFVLRDYAIFNKALLQSNNGEFKKAKKTLEAIPSDSSVVTLSNLLKHYLLNK